MPAPWIRDMLLQGGPLRVQLSADYFVDFPVEVFHATGPGYIAPSDLDLSASLVRDLVAWQRWFDEHTDLGQDPIEQGGRDEWDGWRARAELLAERLQQELGPAYEVLAPRPG